VLLAVNSEFSAIQEITARGYVKIAKSEVETEVSLGLGKSMLIGSKHVDRTGEGKTGVPIIRRIPVLNWFFGRKTGQSEKTHTGFVVTPSITGELGAPMADATAGTDALLEKIKAKLAKKEQ